MYLEVFGEVTRSSFSHIRAIVPDLQNIDEPDVIFLNMSQIDPKYGLVPDTET